MSRPWKVLIAVGGCVAVLVGVVAFGKWLHKDLDRRGYFTVTIADLSVTAPPDMTRVDFLAEVAYQSKLPATLDRTDPETAKKLKDAFAAHPWVENVVMSDLAGAEPVKLVMRIPTMSVGPRVVDRLGVLLPLRTSIDGLSTYKGTIKEVGTPSGSPHPDVGVVAVAQTLGWLKKNAPAMNWKTAEITSDGMVLTRADGGKVIWGFAKGAEPPAEKKLDRLKEWQGGVIDLRK